MKKTKEGINLKKLLRLKNTGSGKTKRRGMTFGKTAKTKKAIVQLTEARADIEIFEGL